MAADDDARTSRFSVRGVLRRGTPDAPGAPGASDGERTDPPEPAAGPAPAAGAGEPGGSEDLWFDADSLRAGGWSTRMPVTGLAEAVAAFAEANDLDHDRVRAPDLPGSRLTTLLPCLNVLTSRTTPLVELGNHGAPLVPAVDSLVADRHGYLAIHHGLDVPWVEIPSSSTASSIRNTASVAINVAMALDPSGWDAGGGGGPSPHHVDLPPAAGFRARTGRDGAEPASRLLAPATWPLLAHAHDGFTLEVAPGWVFAYCEHGDVVTRDPRVWAWVFSVMSRLLEVVELWREEWPELPADDPRRRASAPGAGAFDVRSVPGWTDRVVPRPAHLDGVLDKPIADLGDRLRRRRGR